MPEPQGSSHNFHHDLTRYTESKTCSESNNITPPPQQGIPSSTLLLEPISSTSSVENDLQEAGTSSSAEGQRLEFPSSALDLYTSLLQETATIGQHVVDSSPHTSSLTAPVLSNNAVTCSDVELPTDFDGGYMSLSSEGSFPTQVGLHTSDLTYAEDSSSNGNLGGSGSGLEKIELNIDATEKTVEPPIDLELGERTSDEEKRSLDSRSGKFLVNMTNRQVVLEILSRH